MFWVKNWPYGSGAIGVTQSSVFNTSCGSVTDDTGATRSLNCTYDADIIFNDANYFWTNSETGVSTDIRETGDRSLVRGATPEETARLTVA